MGAEVGIVYGTASGMVRRVIVPDADEGDDATRLVRGESIVKVPRSTIHDMADINAAVQAVTGFPPPSARCVAVDHRNVVDAVIYADPLIDEIPGRELFLSSSANVGETFLWPDQLRYYTEFPEREFWGSSGATSVSGGVFRSNTWSFDNNHLVSKGGVGMLHLLAFRDHQGWEREVRPGVFQGSNFTDARLRASLRGVNFSANGSQFYAWIQARHPTIPGKFVNWGRTGNILTPALLTGTFNTIEVTLDADPAMWSWGKGNGPSYDVFLPIAECLTHIYNVHLVMIGPDDVATPGGSFEMDWFEMIYRPGAAP